MDPFDWSGIFRSITASKVSRCRRNNRVGGFCRQSSDQVHSIREYLDPQDLKKSLSRMQQGIVSFYILLIVAGLFISTNAAPQQGYWSQFDEEDPEALMEIIRLGHTMIRNPELENNKRGLDLGLNRGFSGSQAAKHLMGLAAANYAGGPGRRRRSEQP
ncbi:hypothetical protein K0M31_018226 [Melipona bicolor]|uniref:Diuretic hormone class 2 n=1 Tax=Melipona bicolor TaxID=60889 RepID=A0AA40FDN5_9HYME|nr:hypothetical protein K0M31_018226 [Melipona bicolor]